MGWGHAWNIALITWGLWQKLPIQSFFLNICKLAENSFYYCPFANESDKFVRKPVSGILTSSSSSSVHLQAAMDILDFYNNHLEWSLLQHHQWHDISSIDKNIAINWSFSPLVLFPNRTDLWSFSFLDITFIFYILSQTSIIYHSKHYVKDSFRTIKTLWDVSPISYTKCVAIVEPLQAPRRWREAPYIASCFDQF